MSKRAEEKAWEAYPYEHGVKGLICETSRAIFIRGFEYAEKDTLERAIAWLEEHANEYIVDLTPTYPDAPVNIIVGGMCWDDLREAMGQEHKNYRIRFAEMPVVSDTAITWRDIKSIVKIADDLDPLHDHDAMNAEFHTEEAFYKEVLKRFEEGRK